ncbi:hypothetical protein NA56DRAFT_705176 [Hyaloscypha hepaticicola]|uniref:2EXR domain-containing protein n=1 Tax=Hyaloscypha hepaticicola TaxID=2082293 RepID=A0A2J6Q0W4_9HELO|nr:hypothetical protein NA56DRAFT_705176 [Hyaloscypha hepaticicola]
MDHQSLSISLELLLHELPDPDQDLTVQQFDNHRFALFPMFPLELRQMIWIRALPKPQRVCLYVCQRHYQQPNSRLLPATLHANQESRQVTLENYVIPLFPLRSSMKNLPTEGAGKSDNSGQYLGGSEDNDCMPLGRIASCFDPVRDTLYLDIRTPFEPEFKYTMAKLQRAFPKEFNKVLRMEISNASLENLIASAIPCFPSLTNLTLLGSCLEEFYESATIRDAYNRVFGNKIQEHRDADLRIVLTKYIEFGIENAGKWSIPKINIKH